MKLLNLILGILIKYKKTKHGICKQTTINLTSNIDKHTCIGRYCYIGKNVNITKSEIGNYTSIANNVSIGQGEHITTFISTCSMFYENEYDELTRDQCIIGNDVWIGAGAIVLRGVKLGNGVIIGANAVVTKDIPDFCIAVGIPARVIKKRLPDRTILLINESKWWEQEYNEAMLMINKIIENTEKI